MAPMPLIVMDGSLSTDEENDPLQFTWADQWRFLRQRQGATNVLRVGSYTLTLVVSEAAGSGSYTLLVMSSRGPQAVAS